MYLWLAVCVKISRISITNILEEKKTASVNELNTFILHLSTSNPQLSITMKRRTSATVPVNQDDEKTSPKTDSKTTSSTPIIQRRVALFDSRQPPYEHPIDLRLGLHFNGDRHACSRICRSDATSTSLDERFKKCAMIPEGRPSARGVH